jgi:hypothetical protein
MTAAAIATMEAATITAVSCPFACSRESKRRALRTRVRARLAKAEPASRVGKEYDTYRPHAAYACHTGSGLFGRFGDGSASRVRSDVREGTARIRVEPAVHAIVERCEAHAKWVSCAAELA